MKNKIIYFLLLLSFSSQGQKSYVSEIEEQRKIHVKEMTSPETGILNQEELDAYLSHDYFSIDPSYKFKAKLHRLPSEFIAMQTSSGKQKIYEVIGWVNIKLKNQPKEALYILQDTILRKNKMYEDYYFIPFKDATSGTETYGAGRYLDVHIERNKVVIDFNKAYNPYCAFSYRYNCPIPPKRNNLKIYVKAGEKTPLLHDK